MVCDLLKKIIIFLLFPVFIIGCAAPLPSNYLSPSTIEYPQYIHGQWVKPILIHITPEFLSSTQGCCLLAPVMRPRPYLIGPYDNLNIIVWGHPELSTIATSVPATPSFSTVGGNNILTSIANNNASAGATNPAILVQSDGTIFFPFVGRLHVGGLTVEEAETRITMRLSRYIRHPQVSVQVAKFRNRSLYVLGEVLAPGMQPITDKPLTLMEAISVAGGIDPASADPTHIYVIRGSYLQPYIFWLSAKNPQSLIIAEEFPLQERDIVYVSSAGLTGLRRFLDQIVPPLTTYTIARGLSR